MKIETDLTVNIRFSFSSYGVAMFRYLFIIPVFFMAGCAAVSTNVTTFHEISVPVKTESVAIVAMPETLNSSLEFKTYRSMLKKYLEKAGFKIVQNPVDADYIAFFSYGFFSYGIENGATTTESESAPIHDQTRGGTTHHSGTVSSVDSTAIYNGSSYTMPTYGLVGSQSFSYDNTEFTRKVAIDIVEKNSLSTDRPHKIYEVRAISTGTCGAIVEVMPQILQAIFKDFPGQSGRSRLVQVPWDGTTGCL